MAGPSTSAVTGSARLGDERSLPGLIATAIFTGLRLMELLALRWQDLDSEEIRVRHQLSRKDRRLVELKTDSALREIALRPKLARLLREHRMRSRFKQPQDFVFASETGGPLGWRNVERRAIDAAFELGNALETAPRNQPQLGVAERKPRSLD